VIVSTGVDAVVTRLAGVQKVTARAVTVDLTAEKPAHGVKIVVRNAHGMMTVAKNEPIPHVDQIVAKHVDQTVAKRVDQIVVKRVDQTVAKHVDQTAVKDQKIKKALVV
jgi:hypothetical protein